MIILPNQESAVSKAMKKFVSELVSKELLTEDYAILAIKNRFHYNDQVALEAIEMYLAKRPLT